MRMDFDPEDMDARRFYKLLTAVVVPRPIAWVSSVSTDGVHNLAPHSFFTIASTVPPVAQFTSVGTKDSVQNIAATDDFVINLACESLFEQINATATNFPAELSEFDECGIEREPGATVKAPRVSGSPVALECRKERIIDIGDCHVVLGRVLRVAVDETVLDGEHPRIDLLKPLARLGRDEWSALGPVRSKRRIRYQDWPQGFQHG